MRHDFDSGTTSQRVESPCGVFATAGRATGKTGGVQGLERRLSVCHGSRRLGGREGELLDAKPAGRSRAAPASTSRAPGWSRWRGGPAR